MRTYCLQKKNPFSHATFHTRCIFFALLIKSDISRIRFITFACHFVCKKKLTLCKYSKNRCFVSFVCRTLCTTVICAAASINRIYFNFPRVDGDVRHERESLEGYFTGRTFAKFGANEANGIPSCL